MGPSVGDESHHLVVFDGLEDAVDIAHFVGVLDVELEVSVEVEQALVVVLLEFSLDDGVVFGLQLLLLLGGHSPRCLLVEHCGQPRGRLFPRLVLLVVEAVVGSAEFPGFVADLRLSILLGTLGVDFLLEDLEKDLG